MSASTKVYFRMSGAELSADGSPAAQAEIARRAANRARKAPAPTQAIPAARIPAPAKAAKPVGPGSRGGDPVKAIRARLADQAGVRGSADWWAAYRATKGLVLAPAAAAA